MLRSMGTSPGSPWSRSCEEKKRLLWEGFVEKENFKPGVKSDRVMDGESGESIKCQSWEEVS